MMVLRERRIMSEMGRRRERGARTDIECEAIVRGVRVRGECAIYFPDIVKGSKDESSERPLDNTTT